MVSTESVLLGLLVATLSLAVSDLHLTVPRVAVGIRRLVHFTGPLAIAGLTVSALLISDRLIVGGLGSAEILGVYSAAISLVERPVNLIAISVSTVTFSVGPAFRDRVASLIPIVAVTAFARARSLQSALCSALDRLAGVCADHSALVELAEPLMRRVRGPR